MALGIPGGRGATGKWVNWDFPLEHEQGERRKGTLLIFNRHGFTNLDTAARFSECLFPDFIYPRSFCFLLCKLGSFEKKCI